MGAPRGTLEERFRRHTAIAENGCWEWQGSVDGSGYGMLSRPKPSTGAKMLRAHRVSYELYRGAIPPDRCVLHRCDNVRCVRPDHLFLGSRTENNADRDQKGRHIPLQGKQHGNAKLTDEAVDHIRHLWRAGHPTSGIAAFYRIHPSTVANIGSGRAWKHLG